MQNVKNAFAKAGKYSFSVAAGSFLASLAVDIPLIKIFLVAYTCLSFIMGTTFSLTVIVLWLAGKKVDKQLGEHRQPALPPWKGMPFPEWQKQHYGRPDPPK